MKRFVSAGLVALVFFLAQSGWALPAPRAVLLGMRTVDFSTDHDEIVVSRVRGLFRKLEFRVSGNDLEIFNLSVVYANGESDSIPTQLIFREGEWSRVIDLAAGKRFIHKIVFNYRTAGSLRRGKAVVKVFGIR